MIDEILMRNKTRKSKGFIFGGLGIVGLLALLGIGSVGVLALTGSLIQVLTAFILIIIGTIWAFKYSRSHRIISRTSCKYP